MYIIWHEESNGKRMYYTDNPINCWTSTEGNATLVNEWAAMAWVYSGFHVTRVR